jgi:cytochrome c556
MHDQSRRIGFLALVCGIAALAGHGAARAHSHQSKGELAVEYRMSLYTVIAANFAPLADMAEGKIPFNAADAEMRAERVAFIAPMLKEAFPPDSNGVAHTAAKPEIWTNPTEFNQALQALIDKSAALAAAAKTGDAAKFNTAVQETGKTCKSCHDKFKVKD